MGGIGVGGGERRCGRGGGGTLSQVVGSAASNLPTRNRKPYRGLALCCRGAVGSGRIELVVCRLSSVACRLPSVGFRGRLRSEVSYTETKSW